MGFLRNLLIGGARPKVQGDEVRCGQCREVLQPDSKRCPHCSTDIFTLKGRVLSRFPGLFGIGILAAGSGSGSIFGYLLLPIGLALIAVAIYYYLKAPIYYVRPPHRPTRPER